VKLGMADKTRRESEALDFEEAAPSAGSVAAMIGTKNLLIAIVTMPFVFLVVVMAIISIFGSPDKDRSAAREAPAEAASPVATQAETQAATQAATLEEPALSGQQAVIPIPTSATALSSAISIPEGARAGAISLDGDRLAVRIDGESGAMIVIYDLEKGEPVQIIPLTTDGTN